MLQKAIMTAADYQFYLAETLVVIDHQAPVD